ncbi:MAG TPA: hypothetical protein DEB40_09600 [Elusimicrobia bacterium]|nr:hypothetical protein [Elusimicrobiota bacterium]HBT61983.1 hypothetical protein [Elusimicrobiota bacterium]
MSIFARSAAILSICAAFFGCTRNVANLDMSDAGIKTRIETEFQSQTNVELQALTINVDNGFVILSGMVKSTQEKDLLERIARRTRGVEQVMVNVVVQE